MIFVATWAEALPILDLRPKVTGIGCRSYPREGIDAMVSAGFAGACRTDLATGDVLLAGEVSHDLRIALGSVDGQLRTLTHIATPTDKAELASEGVAAVDMETEYVANAAAAAHIPFLGLRVIIDRAQDSGLSVWTVSHYPLAARRLRWAVLEGLKRWPGAVEQARPG